jgi:reactive intermediate/imine deaminase
MTASDLRHAPATERNRDPILAILRRVLPPHGLVLEVASGSGQHVAWFAAALPDLHWQPTDPDPAARLSIAAWCAESGVRNVRAPLAIDAARGEWPVERADALLCINMVHIAPWAATVGLMAGAARLLPQGGPLLLYGPYKRGGHHTAPSNEAFDLDLRARDAAWGVRDLEAIVDEASKAGLTLEEVVEMPANNLTVIFRRRKGGRMEIEPIATAEAAAPGGHYSQAMACGGLLFVSGQLPVRPDGSHMADAPFEAQARQVLHNLLAIVQAGGSSPDRLLKVTVYIADIGHWPAFNRIYAEMLGDAKPARAVVPVPELHHGYLVEVEAVAAR